MLASCYALLPQPEQFQPFPELITLEQDGDLVGVAMLLSGQVLSLSIFSSLEGVDLQECWIVSWQRQTLAICRRSDAQLQLVSTLLVSDTLTSPLLTYYQGSVLPWRKFSSSAT
ncbi:MAG: hypothetical protein WCA35_26845, partial [Kovacikia sp.]